MFGLKRLVLIDRPADNFNRAFLENDLEVFKPVRFHVVLLNAVFVVEFCVRSRRRGKPPAAGLDFSTSAGESSFARGSTARLASPKTPRNSSNQGPHTPDS